MCRWDAVANIDIKYNNKTKNVSYKERQNIENISDFFDLRNYENIIKKNFANSFIRKLNLELLNMK